jgi:hypothetical protein
MGSLEHPNAVNGNTSSYSVPREAEKVFYEGIFSNDLITKDLPADVKETARKIQFTGTDRPSIPINWRFAESAAALTALEASVIGALLKQKYGIEAPTVEINTSCHPTSIHLILSFRSLTRPQRPCPTLLHVHPPLDPRPLRRSHRFQQPLRGQEHRRLLPKLRYVLSGTVSDFASETIFFHCLS